MKMSITDQFMMIKHINLHNLVITLPIEVRDMIFKNRSKNRVKTFIVHKGKDLKHNNKYNR
jgi:hypothetical protein